MGGPSFIARGASVLYSDIRLNDFFHLSAYLKYDRGDFYLFFCELFYSYVDTLDMRIKFILKF